MCPQCGGKVVPIEYGNPCGDVALQVRAQQRVTISGGCVVPPDAPDRGCVQCGQWFVDGEPSGSASKGWPNPWPN